MNPTHHELLPTLLFRASRGDRASESAIILLIRAELLDQLTTSIIIDLDRNLAWIDWPALHHHAGYAADDIRAVLLLASTLATQGLHLRPHHHQALGHAVSHLTGWP